MVPGVCELCSATRRLKLQTFVREVFATIHYMRADLALEAERTNFEIDKVSRDGEERIDRWLRHKTTTHQRMYRSGTAHLMQPVWC